MAIKTKNAKSEQKKDKAPSVSIKDTTKEGTKTKTQKTPSKNDIKPVIKTGVKSKNITKEQKGSEKISIQKKSDIDAKQDKSSSKKNEPQKDAANLKTKESSKSSKLVESKKTKIEKPVEVVKVKEKQKTDKAKSKSEPEIELAKEKDEKKSKKSIKPEVKAEEKKTKTKEKAIVQTKEETKEKSEIKAPKETGASEKPKPTVRYSDEDLEMFKMKILEVRKEAIEELGMLKERLEDLTNYDFAEESMIYSMHMAEQGSEAMEKEKTYAQIQRINEYIKKLDEALQRIADKTYGICRECGILIAKERLLAVPITTLSASWKIRKVCPEDGIDRIEPLK
jgi:RNA polymerase-binding transcription factor DksA